MSLHLQGWTKPKQGVLFVVTGASGTGKTTLVREALSRIPGIHFSVSATTRPMRKGEEEGKDYHFLSEEEARFRNDIATSIVSGYLVTMPLYAVAANIIRVSWQAASYSAVATTCALHPC